MSYRVPEPFEAIRLPLIEESDGIDQPLRDLATAVCGFPYPGDKSQAIIDTVKYLRSNPDMAAVLGIGYQPASAGA